ncbi:hypothetical protein AVL48_06860 [Amycolatopsis regifaucium]|uniref:Uncharacterized protein n=1 Tax=Amycolatopsis regifaucium TaxID=546365 RepID=A0A154MBP5_9PSEU|nr:hypothetical protein AVL48_06860 [Amycolatopsis regifaucium]OKA06238.1 hypothetical protein ATP06_0224160 [Amycolatopsis regifaucium]
MLTFVIPLPEVPMPRAAQRRPSADAASSAAVETVELLDRTGIIAASLPKRRRSPENEREPEPLPIRPPVCAPVVDKDLRPKAVVIHRRARSWLAGGAGVALLAIGWIAGMTTLASPVDDALSEQPLPAVATQQAVPQPPAAQPAPQPAPVTVYVPVTVKQQVPATTTKKKAAAKDQVVALPPAQTSASEQPRIDTGSSDKAADDLRNMMDPTVASSLAMRMAQGMMTYSSGR